jgi:dihydrofolate reductase
MRKVIFGINISLDGCCDHTRFNPGPDKEILDYFTQLMLDADTLVYGRKTYELMVPYWPDIAKNHTGDSPGENEFALAFDAIPRMIVFSKSLRGTEAKNTTVIATDIGETILQLKKEEGKNISTGGVDIPSQLMALDLIDEYHFVVHPIIAGAGARLLDGINLPGRSPLKLVESTIFNSGCVALHYVKQ